MWKEGGNEALLSRATQSRLQMCRQQSSGCVGPHQAALGVSPTHVPTPPVNQPSQASGSTAATKTLRPDPLNRLSTDKQTPMSPCYASNSLPLCLFKIKSCKNVTTLFHVQLFFSPRSRSFTPTCRCSSKHRGCPPVVSENNAAQCHKPLSGYPHLGRPQLVCLSAP